jgi:hypothetical protein
VTRGRSVSSNQNQDHIADARNSLAVEHLEHLNENISVDSSSANAPVSGPSSSPLNHNTLSSNLSYHHLIQLLAAAASGNIDQQLQHQSNLNLFSSLQQQLQHQQQQQQHHHDATWQQNRDANALAAASSLGASLAQLIGSNPYLASQLALPPLIPLSALGIKPNVAGTGVTNPPDRDDHGSSGHNVGSGVGLHPLYMNPLFASLLAQSQQQQQQQQAQAQQQPQQSQSQSSQGAPIVGSQDMVDGLRLPQLPQFQFPIVSSAGGGAVSKADHSRASSPSIPSTSRAPSAASNRSGGTLKMDWSAPPYRPGSAVGSRGTTAKPLPRRQESPVSASSVTPQQSLPEGTIPPQGGPLPSLGHEHNSKFLEFLNAITSATQQGALPGSAFLASPSNPAPPTSPSALNQAYAQNFPGGANVNPLLNLGALGLSSLSGFGGLGLGNLGMNIPGLNFPFPPPVQGLGQGQHGQGLDVGTNVNPGALGNADIFPFGLGALGLGGVVASTSGGAGGGAERGGARSPSHIPSNAGPSHTSGHKRHRSSVSGYDDHGLGGDFDFSAAPAAARGLEHYITHDSDDGIGIGIGAGAGTGVGGPSRAGTSSSAVLGRGGSHPAMDIDELEGEALDDGRSGKRGRTS